MNENPDKQPDRATPGSDEFDTDLPADDAANQSAMDDIPGERDAALSTDDSQAEDDPNASDEALHDAIDTLESMLAKHGIGESAEGASPNRHSSVESDRPTIQPIANEDPDGQFTIPLLSEVVVSGGESGGLSESIRAILPDSNSGYEDVPRPGHNDMDDIGGDDIELIEEDYEAELYAHLIARLKSEIEVIVQGEIETIVKDASKQIARKVDTHVQIVLPEILDEIALILSQRNRKR